MQFPDTKIGCQELLWQRKHMLSREAMIFEDENNSEQFRAPTREISCLMGFPVNYQYEGKHNIKHKQIGNAVCVQLSHALALAYAKKDNLNICKIRQRDNIKLDCEQTNPLFDNFVQNPKKINNKYCRHIPYLKLNQFRVELDNIKSNLKDKDNNKHIDTLNIIWTSSIHTKGQVKRH